MLCYKFYIEWNIFLASLVASYLYLWTGRYFNIHDDDAQVILMNHVDRNDKKWHMHFKV